MEKCELGFTVKFTNPPKIDFLQEHKNLIIDTKHFGQEFKEKLISTIDNLDEQTNGVLIHSENFQAQRLLQERYKGTINCIYIDPPYNAQSSEILYKNSYKHSSWLSLIYDRLKISRYLLNYPAVNIIAVDEVENFKLGLMISQIFPDYEDSCISIQHNPTGQQGINFSFTHEFAHFIFPKGQSCIGLDDRNEQNRGSEPDVRPLRNVSSGKNHYRNSAANCFYPIFVKGGKIIGFGDVSDDSFHPDGINELLKNDVIAVYPIDPSNNESKWVFARDTVESIADELRAEYDPKKNIWDIIRTKSRFRYKSLWSDKRYSANSWGSVILNNMFKKVPFDYPKSIYTVSDCIDAGLNNKSYGIVLDYFAGSGTTGHAVTNLNREDKGNRKYILVEMGDYFNTVTKPRMQKVIYAAEWKNGKPTSRVTGVSHIMKYFQLESYEDTLTNIKLSDDAQKQHSSLFREEYMVKYMLDIESKGSLINLDQFRTPFTYKLKITEKNETNEKTIDLVETFNYLIGLKVKKLRVRDGFKTVEGTLPDGQKSFVFWRNLSSNEEKDNKILIGFFNELRKEIDFTGIKKIFINGDNSLANMRQNNETFDVCLTETVFKEKMFEV
jgi:adenine-specific DNA-methyltransferase